MNTRHKGWASAGVRLVVTLAVLYLGYVLVRAYMILHPADPALAAKYPPTWARWWKALRAYALHPLQ